MEFSEGNFLYHGVCQRYTNYKIKPRVRHYFEKFQDSRKEPIKLEYDYAHANLKAEMPSVSKYDRPQPHYDEDAWTFGLDCLAKHFFFLNGSRELPLDVVVANLALDTSPGYPFSRKYATKRELVACIDFCRIHQQFVGKNIRT